jgi:hypothetical protein
VPGLRVVGLTSRRNLAFTRALGLYDDVFAYDELEVAPALAPAVGQRWLYVDVAGVASLNQRVFAHFAPALALAAGVTLGMSTLNPADAQRTAHMGANAALAVPAAHTARAPLGPADMDLFFMVEWLALRRREWDKDTNAEMQNAAWAALLRDGRAWVRLERVYGGEAAGAAYRRVLRGELGPEVGYIWSLWDHEGDGKQRKRNTNL